MTLYKYSIKKVITLLIIVFTFILMIFSGFSSTLSVSADETIDITKTSVKEDLKSMDEDKVSYISDSENIFIAMSQYYDLNNDLRTYVYLNFVDFDSIRNNSLKIKLSTAVSDENYNINESYNYYSLTLINFENTWFKYEVMDLQNLESVTRRYKIDSIGIVDTSILNTSDKIEQEGGLDGGGSNESSDSNDEIEDDGWFQLFEEINKVYIFHGLTNDSIEVFKEEIETITITDKEIKFYCYGDGANVLIYDTDLMNEGDVYTDAWYVFFNTDKPIDTLMEVELTFTQYDYFLHRSAFVSKTYAITEEELENQKNANGWIADDLETGESHITYHEPKTEIYTPGTEKVAYVDKGWFGHYDTYYRELDKIMDLREYKEKKGDKFVFTEQAEKYTWGVNFANTTKSFSHYDSVGDLLPVAIDLQGSGMSDVAILRLKYKTNGLVHNAYAVDLPSDDFTGESADEDTKWEKLFQNNFDKLMSLIGILVLILILNSFFPLINSFIKLVSKLLNYVLNGIVFIISAPFKLLGSLFKPKKRKR